MKREDKHPAAAVGMRPPEAPRVFASRFSAKEIRMRSKRRLKRSDQLTYMFLWLLGISIMGLVIFLLRGCA